MARAVDRFESCYAGGATPAPDWPLERHVEVTPTDVEGQELEFVTRALNVSKDCTVAVIDRDDRTVSLTLTKGDNFHRVRQVLAEGTDSGVTIFACD